MATDPSVGQLGDSGFAAREAALDRINDDPAWAQRAYGAITAAVQSERPDDQQLSHWLPWRAGRKVGRTIYAQVGDAPSDSDPLIGVMDSAAIANEAVTAHNAALRSAQKP